jgi:CubicO group peptidase (beta-lactamase class C family)
MKKEIIFSLLFLLVASRTISQIQPSDCFATQEVTLTEKQTELIFEHLSVFPERTQLSIAFINEGKVYFSGVIYENDTIRIVNNHQSVFEIGSISKVFTASILASMVVDGKVCLDDSINDYLDFPLIDSIRISFKQLANHTSGLPRMPSNFSAGLPFNPANPYQNYEPDFLINYLTRHMELDYKPGERSEYSNLGAGLLAYTLSRISRSDYQELLNKYLLSKYGMTNTTTNRANIASKMVKGLDQNGKETSNWDFSVLVGAGGILSTTEDLAKFAVAQFDESNKELKLTRMKTFQVNENLTIGLGWHIVKSLHDKELYCHNGGTGGYSSSVALDVIHSRGIIVLSNLSAFHPQSTKIEQLCFSLIRTLEETSKQ